MARVSFRLRKASGGAALRNDVTRTLEDGAIDTGVSATTLTSATANFFENDVGADITVVGAGPAAADLVTTIASVTNATTVELTDAASTTVSGATFSIVADDTDGLRADGLQIAPGSTVTAAESFFEATSSCYGEVSLAWDLPIVTTLLTATPEPRQYVVVYSPFGPPETIVSGSVIAEGNDSFSITHKGLTGGEFAYYTLFVRYQSTADDYYERVTTVSEMVPFNYGSTIDMWNRIPSYYRDLDTRNGSIPSAAKVACMGFDNYGDNVGPLLSFISIFGFEMDRTRSLAAHTARSKDPQYADTSSLEYLAQELGTIIDLDDLGAIRLRKLLNDIGSYRRSKGTEAGVEFAVRSITGNDAEVDEVNRSIDINAGRVNFITDPKNTKSPTDIETTAVAEFGEAESAERVGIAFPSSSTRYPRTDLLSSAEFVAATPGLEAVGTAEDASDLGVQTNNNVTDVEGATTYTGTADPDVVVPSGHMLAVNDDTSVATNYIDWSVTGTSLDLTFAQQPMVCGVVFSVTETTPAATRTIAGYGIGGAGEFSINQNTSGDIFASFYDDISNGGDTPAFTPTLNTLYYAQAYLDSTWDNLYLKVYDATGEVFSTSLDFSTDPTDPYSPTNIRIADHAGGLEMVHLTYGQKGLRAWDDGLTISQEWLIGQRTASGGTLYTLDSPVTLSAGETIYFSVHSGVGVLGNLTMARMVDTVDPTIVYGYTDLYGISGGVPYFAIPVTSSGTGNVEFFVKDNSTFGNSLYLLEKNTEGPYFDGSVIRGGWLDGNPTFTDFRWQGGAANENNDESLYSEDYERSKQVYETVYQSTLPVDVAPLYIVTHNNLP